MNAPNRSDLADITVITHGHTMNAVGAERNLARTRRGIEFKKYAKIGGDAVTTKEEAQMYKGTIRYPDEKQLRLAALVFVRSGGGKRGDVTLNSVYNEALDNYLRDHGLPPDEEKVIIELLKRQGGIL